MLQIASFCVIPAFGATYKDIPSSHWAYESIENLSEKGYLADFKTENFNPDSYIDKFTIAKILSIAAGYKSGDYSSKNNIISKYSEKFTRWNNKIHDRIAFLLTKNIFLDEDLDSFMLFSDDGSEKFRAISREELAVFLVRLMGKTDDAKKLENSNFFKDSSSITASRKGSINYLKSINVLNGGVDGLCKPQSAVTKAEFCVLLNNTTEFMKNKTDSSSSNVTNISGINGIVDNYYKSLGIIQIKINDEIKPYRLNQNAVITLDKGTVSKDKIVSGLSVSAILSNSEITELHLSSKKDESSSETTTESTTETTTSENKDNNTVSETRPPYSSDNLCNDSEAEGTIQSIQINPSLQNECLIGIVSSDGELKNFSATRYTVPIYSLRIGDSVGITAKNGKISSLKFTRKNNKNIAIGYITDIDDDELVLENSSKEEITFYYDEDTTECFDCETGKKIDFDNIKKHTEVYILYEDSSSRLADIIFVLDNL